MAPGPRSLPGVALGNHAAADPRLGGARALSPFPAAISHGAETGLGAGAGSAGRVERAGILPARPHDACRRESHREAAWREISRCIAELRALPGIGRYTAAAIASIVFDVPAAVVDGNVERVLGRVFGTGLTGEGFWQTADTLLSRKRPGDFNQAMMELGATVCLPRQPRCSACPVLGLCATRGHLELPKKLSRQKRRDICYALDHRNRSVFLVQRPKHSSLMPGMWELPEIPAANRPSAASFTLRHSITVTDYTVRVMRGPVPEPNQGQWVPRKSILRLPLTGLTRKILRQAHVI